MALKPGETRDKIEFGNGFEIDLRQYQLRQSGRVLRLEPTPMELLLFLLEHKGELITRDQIVEKIWGQGVFLDTDNSINGAIRKIRQVLRDNPERPRFVQTIPGRGYRFIAPVNEDETKEEAQEYKGPSEHSAPAARAGAETDQPKRWISMVAVAIAVLGLGLTAYRYFHRAPKLTDKDTIVLGDFVNSTGDPVFDDTLRQGLAVQLEQSPFLSLISDERMQQMLKQMAKPAETRLTPEIAREICQRTASAAVLDGSIVSLGSQYVLTLRAKNCRSADILDEEQVQAAKKEDVLNALSQISSKFRTRVGESLSTIKSHDAPLAEATTPFLEALKAYSVGWQVSFLSGPAAAVPFFQRAIEIDPNFASAYAALGRMYGDIGESSQSAKNTSQAYKLRDRASDQEKFFISTTYDLQVTGNLENARQTLEVWMQAYPRAWIPHALLSGGIYPQLGKFENSLAEAKTAIAGDPDFAIGYSILAGGYLALERRGEADTILQQASERKLDIPDFDVQRYVIAFLKNDKQDMERETANAQDKPEVDHWMASAQGFVLAYSGHLEEARKMSRRAAELARKAGRRDTEALYQADEAVREALFGNVSNARQKARNALELSRGRDGEYRAACALVLLGDSSRSRMLTDDLSRRFPDDTIVQFTYLPTLRAFEALNRKQSAEALELLQTAAPYERGTPFEGGSDFLMGAGNFYPAYIRGMAYLMARRGREAAAEFQKILDHPGIVLSDPIGAISRIQLGRAYSLARDQEKARSAYEDFLKLWKDADHDIPIFQQAKGEYAKLE